MSVQKNNSDFKAMNAAELKKYLQDRGVSVSGYLKPSFVEIASAVERRVLLKAGPRPSGPRPTARHGPAARRPEGPAARDGPAARRPGGPVARRPTQFCCLTVNPRACSDLMIGFGRANERR